MEQYIVVFIINMLIELVVAAILGYRKRVFILAVVAVNCITHPILHVIIYGLILQNVYTIWIVLGLEIIVICTEWKLFEFICKEKKRKYLILATVINLSSYTIGQIATLIIQ